MYNSEEVRKYKVEGWIQPVNALIVYWSATGNTKKVAETIHHTLESAGADSKLLRLEEAGDEDLHDYDLVFLGAPSYSFQAPAPVQEYVKRKMAYHRKRGDIRLRTPKLPGKKAVAFVTYSGPHTGIREATPVGQYLGQFFEHIGIEVAGEWYTVGEFHNSEENSTKGVLGDIRGRPNRQDLDEIAANVKALLNMDDGLQT